MYFVGYWQFETNIDKTPYIPVSLSNGGIKREYCLPTHIPLGGRYQVKEIYLGANFCFVETQSGEWLSFGKFAS
jgi:hypothetical protein